MELAIDVKKLSKKFNGITAVNDLDLSVAKGEIFGIVGPDGAGKTTLMRLLTCVMEPSSGSGKVSGFDIISDSEKVKERIGYMPQGFSLYEELTVEENIDFFADIFQVKKEEREQKKEILLEYSMLTPFKTRLAGNLSGGMKKKLALSCSLIHKPDILFLDEPTTGLDPVSRREFWRILYSLGGVTIFLSTPYMDEAERCSKVGFMHNGELKAVDSPDNLKSYFKGALMEIKCSLLRKARNSLRDKLGMTSIYVFGDKLHALVKDFVSQKDKVQELLKNEGIEIFEIREISPSLEDIFVPLIEK